MKLSGVQQAILAGLCASMGSVSGKLMTQERFATPIKGAFLVANIASTVLMIGLFTRAMHVLSTTAATIVNSCANFVFTAIFGVLLFGEELGVKWFAGTILLTVGVALILSAEQDSNSVVTTAVVDQKEQ